MKIAPVRALFISAFQFLSFSAFQLNAQTVFVPNGTIGSSANDNIGIGTSTPGAKLESVVTGNGIITEGLRLSNNGSGLATGVKLTFSNVNPQATIKSYYDGDWKLGLAADAVGDVLTIRSSTGNVGIGTTSPIRRLDVAGNIGVLNINAQRQFTYAVVGDANTDLYLRSASSFAQHGANAGIFLARSDYQDAGTGNDMADLVGLHIGGFYDNSGTGLPLYLGGFLYNSQDPAVTITSKYNDGSGGRVGIGTTNPGASLEVYQPGADNSTIESIHLGSAHGYNRSTSITFGRNSVAIEGGNYNARIIGTANAPSDYGSTLQLQTHSAASGIWNSGIFINHDGNVGIGTTDPSVPLEVNGSGTIVGLIKSTGHSYLRLQSTDDTKQLAIDFANSGSTEVGGLNFNLSNNVLLLVNSAPTGNIALMPTGGGNVGIGTTTPAAKLDVVGSINASGGISAASLTLAGQLFNPANFLQNSISFTVAPSGSVGIGTTDPGANKLTVSGGNLGVYSSSNPSIAIGDAAAPFYFTNSGSYLNISAYDQTAANTKISIARDSGNIGIGSTSPSTKLDVSGADSTISYIVSRLNGNSSGYGAFQQFTDGATYNFGIGTVPTSGDFTFYSGRYPGTPGTERMRITQAGYVGIGNNSPWVKLDVSGADSTISYIVSRLNGNSSGYGAFQQFTDGATYNFGIGTAPTSGDFTFYSGRYPGTAGTERMRITQAGNVGIGTTAPDNLLTVKGTIHASEVVVDAKVTAKVIRTNDVLVQPKAWADDVFDDGRALQPLSAVEQSIKQHKHLPGVPSAQEVAANGVSVADMQVVLLQKIEELTLHMIQIDKENAQLRQEVETLKAAQSAPARQP